MTPRLRMSALAAALAATACVASAVGKDEPQQSTVQGEKPSLVVLLVVDQLRGDHLDRVAPLLTGGLARLRNETVYYHNGRHGHALLETAPGHATLGSGRWPTHTNIVSNGRGVGDPEWPLIASDRDGASPARFVGTTIYDWLVAADPESRALSVSRKDRGAILTVGRSKDADVVWYGGEHGFTRSRWYGDALPDWVAAWNGKFDLRGFAGREWTEARPDSAYLEPDDEPWENGGKDRVFPHRLPTETGALADALENVPWMDSLTLDIALAGVHARELGQRGHTDYLTISLSTTDAIGHTWGPESRELQDHLVRLDGWLGAFLDSLALVVPAERTVIALSADHGVTSYPKRTVAQGGTGGIIDLSPMVDSLGSAWRRAFGTDFDLEFDNGLLYGDAPALAAKNVRLDTLTAGLAARIAKHAGVARVLTREVLAAAPDSDRVTALWKRSIPADGTWLLAGVAEPGWVFTGDESRAQHGTLSETDMWVPIAFMVPGKAAVTIERPLETTSVAPTLAWLAGITPTEPIDGTPAAEVVGSNLATR